MTMSQDSDNAKTLPASELPSMPTNEAKQNGEKLASVSNTTQDDQDRILKRGDLTRIIAR